MPVEMLTYSWFADAYKWPPEVVRNLTLEELNWLPVIEQAKAEVQHLRQAAEERRQRSLQGLRGGVA